jgi:hypothetical protein
MLPEKRDPAILRVTAISYSAIRKRLARLDRLIRLSNPSMVLHGLLLRNGNQIGAIERQVSPNHLAESLISTEINDSRLKLHLSPRHQSHKTKFSSIRFAVGRVFLTCPTQHRSLALALEVPPENHPQHRSHPCKREHSQLQKLSLCEALCRSSRST